MLNGDTVLGIVRKHDCVGSRPEHVEADYHLALVIVVDVDAKLGHLEKEHVVIPNGGRPAYLVSGQVEFVH